MITDIIESDETTPDDIDIWLRQQYLEFRRVRARYEASKRILIPLMQAISKLGFESRITATSVDIWFTGDKASLAAVVRAFRTAGFETNTEKPKLGDTTWNAWYRRPDCQVPIYMMFTSAVCKKVQVGTKMVEQPIYETQCGDGTPLLGDGT